jgi:hypothetical protein
MLAVVDKKIPTYIPQIRQMCCVFMKLIKTHAKGLIMGLKLKSVMNSDDSDDA